MIKTADICDAFPDKITVVEAIGFKDFGGRKRFSGMIHTVKCFEDHNPVEKALLTDGTGKVLVVDGGGSARYAIMGDRLAGIAAKNNWNGVLIYGSIRDTEGIGQLDLGVKALHVIPITRVSQSTWDENVPVHFADAAFVPGHFLYSDEDGIVVSPDEIAL